MGYWVHHTDKKGNTTSHYVDKNVYRWSIGWVAFALAVLTMVEILILGNLK